MNAGTRDRGRSICIGITGFTLLAYLGTLLIGYEAKTPFLWTLRCVSAPLTIYYAKLWKDRGFWFLAAYYLLFTARAIQIGRWEVMRLEGWISELSGLWVFTACYGLYRLIPEGQRRRVLGILAAVWIAGTVLNSLVGIYAAWTDKHFYGLTWDYLRLIGREAEYNKSVLFWGFYGNRLSLMENCNQSGAILQMTVLMAFCCGLCAEGKRARILYFLAAVPLLLALALTDARTSIIGLSAGIAVMAFAGVYQGLRSRKRKSGAALAPALRWTVSLLVMLAAFAAAVLLILQITPAFNQVKLQGILPSAYAESPGTVEVSNRGFDFTESMFTGRVKVWRTVFQVLREKPKILLVGSSKLGTMYRVNEILNWPYGHCHNMILQILMESGIPGLLLVLGFLIPILRNVGKAVLSPGTPRWIRLIPAIMVALWVMDMDECFVWLRHGTFPMLPFQFVIYGILANYRPQDAEQPGRIVRQ